MSLYTFRTEDTRSQPSSASMMTGPGQRNSSLTFTAYFEGTATGGYLIVWGDKISDMMAVITYAYYLAS